MDSVQKSEGEVRPTKELIRVLVVGFEGLGFQGLGSGRYGSIRWANIGR